MVSSSVRVLTWNSLKRGFGAIKNLCKSVRTLVNQVVLLQEVPRAHELSGYIYSGFTCFGTRGAVAALWYLDRGCLSWRISFGERALLPQRLGGAHSFLLTSLTTLWVTLNRRRTSREHRQQLQTLLLILKKMSEGYAVFHGHRRECYFR